MGYEVKNSYICIMHLITSFLLVDFTDFFCWFRFMAA